MASPTPSSPTPVRQLRMLLVEDSADDLALMRAALGADAWRQCSIAGDGVEALDRLRRSSEAGDPPDLVLLDLNLPVKGGLEVLREAKADPRLAHIPIVVLSTSSLECDVLAAYRGGAASFVTKPQGLADFRRVVAQLTGYWNDVARLPCADRA